MANDFRRKDSDFGIAFSKKSFSLELLRKKSNKIFIKIFQKFITLILKDFDLIFERFLAVRQSQKTNITSQ
jgi:hypothetical protein